MISTYLFSIMLWTTCFGDNNVSEDDDNVSNVLKVLHLVRLKALHLVRLKALHLVRLNARRENKAMVTCLLLTHKCPFLVVLM